MQNINAVNIPKEIAIIIQMVLDVLCCIDELSENVVDLISSVVICWVFDVDELQKKRRTINAQTAGRILILRKKLITLILYTYRYIKSSNTIHLKIDKLKLL